MTPMIDIVFQLLIFFIMTFKIVSLEGDFNIKMPAAAPSEGPPEEDLLPPLRLRLTAGEEGQLNGIQLDDRAFLSFAELRGAHHVPHGRRWRAWRGVIRHRGRNR